MQRKRNRKRKGKEQGQQKETQNAEEKEEEELKVSPSLAKFGQRSFEVQFHRKFHRKISLDLLEGSNKGFVIGGKQPCRQEASILQAVAVTIKEPMEDMGMAQLLTFQRQAFVCMCSFTCQFTRKVQEYSDSAQAVSARTDWALEGGGLLRFCQVKRADILTAESHKQHSGSHKFSILHALWSH